MDKIKFFIGNDEYFKIVKDSYAYNAELLISYNKYYKHVRKAIYEQKLTDIHIHEKGKIHCISCIFVSLYEKYDSRNKAVTYKIRLLINSMGTLDINNKKGKNMNSPFKELNNLESLICWLVLYRSISSAQAKDMCINRLPAYIHKLRCEGMEIETVEPENKNQSYRYVLKNIDRRAFISIRIKKLLKCNALVEDNLTMYYQRHPVEVKKAIDADNYDRFIAIALFSVVLLLIYLVTMYT